MKKLAYALAVSGVLALSVPTAPATAAIETYEAKMTAASAAAIAREDMFEAFGPKLLKPGQYLWRDVPDSAGQERVVISLADQLAYFYRGETLVAVSTISSGAAETPTPTGIFEVLEKKPMHHSRKYDNAPMPFMQRLDEYGIALHGGANPGYPASHGCVRMPMKFAEKLYALTKVGSKVVIEG